MNPAHTNLEWGDPRSYYHASAKALPLQQPLAADTHCEYLVIGGGMTGASAALQLAERGQQVILIEARRLGWGASGRSGGQMVVGFNKPYGWIRQRYGKTTAQTLFQASLDGIETINRLMQQHQIDADFHRGHYHVATKPRQNRELRAMFEDYRAAGFMQAELLDTADAQAAVCSEKVTQALYDPLSGHLHPLNYTLGLHRAAIKAGAVIHEMTAARQIRERSDGEYDVTTSTGYRIHARKLLLAGNAYLGSVFPPINRYIMPVGTYIIATEPLGDAMSGIIPSRAAVVDLNFVLNYFRPSRQNRMLFGGRVAYSTRTPIAIKQRMAHIMHSYFPKLRDARIDYVWGGNVAITHNRLPQTGRLGKHQHLIYAHGFSGHGVVLTTVYGQLCAGVMMDDQEAINSWQHFAAIKHQRFPGGERLRTPLLALAMTYYRLMDRF